LARKELFFKEFAGQQQESLLFLLEKSYVLKVRIFVVFFRQMYEHHLAINYRHSLSQINVHRSSMLYNLENSIRVIWQRRLAQ